MIIMFVKHYLNSIRTCFHSARGMMRTNRIRRLHAQNFRLLWQGIETRTRGGGRPGRVRGPSIPFVMVASSFGKEGGREGEVCFFTNQFCLRFCFPACTAPTRLAYDVASTFPCLRFIQQVLIDSVLYTRMSSLFNMVLNGL